LNLALRDGLQPGPAFLLHKSAGPSLRCRSLLPPSFLAIPAPPLHTSLHPSLLPSFLAFTPSLPPSFPMLEGGGSSQPPEPSGNIAAFPARASPPSHPERGGGRLEAASRAIRELPPEHYAVIQPPWASGASVRVRVRGGRTGMSRFGRETGVWRDGKAERRGGAAKAHRQNTANGGAGYSRGAHVRWRWRREGCRAGGGKKGG
jgi:hypothetical protein